MNHFDLDTAIRTWRHLLAQRRAFLPDDLDELEQHLRDFVRARVAAGLGEEDAFRQAVARIGDSFELEAEYRKVQLVRQKREQSIWRSITAETIMFRNYLTTLWRSIERHPGYTLINVGGLAIGIAACLLVLLFVRHEQSYDRFHEYADQIYQVVIEDTLRDQFQRILPSFLAADLQAVYPEVVNQTTLFPVPTNILIEANGKRFYEDQFAGAARSFFEVFTYEVLVGDLETALDQPDAVVLTRSIAEKYFGDASAALGETITASDEVRPKVTEQGLSADRLDAIPYTVTAVIEDPPSNSVLNFDLLVHRTPDTYRGWNIPTAQGYIVLNRTTDSDQFAEKLRGYLSQHGAQEYALMFQYFQPRIQPLTEIHLNPNLEASTWEGPARNLYLFSIAGLLLLLIACVNYINLATARSVRRAREVGVRKVVGASRGQLFRQFIAESFLNATLAFLLALVLAHLMGPLINTALGTSLSLSVLFTSSGVLALVVLLVVIALASGAFPALVLSRYQPVQVLKNAIGRSGRGSTLRHALVIFQFAASIVLMLGTLVAYQQMAFVRSERLHTGHDEIVVLRNYAGILNPNYEAFKQTLLSETAIVSIAAGAPPGLSTRPYIVTGKTGQTVQLHLIRADDEYLKTLGLELVAQDALMARPPGDGGPFVLANETALRATGLDAPPLGASVPAFHGTLVGVVRDYHFTSLHQPIGPLVIQLSPGPQGNILVRLREGQVAEGLQQVQAAWRTFVPERPIEFQFLNAQLDLLYQTELRMSRLFMASSVLALFVACLGLFGLAAFTAEQRTKEIGIRKVLGATVPSLIGLLSKDFLRLVLAAFVLAVPVSYLLMQRWLNDFAYRIDLGYGLFLVTGLAALLIALLTVSYQAWRAASTNPTDALRYE